MPLASLREHVLTCENHDAITFPFFKFHGWASLVFKASLNSNSHAPKKKSPNRPLFASLTPPGLVGCAVTSVVSKQECPQGLSMDPQRNRSEKLTINLSSINGLGDFTRALAVNLAADAKCSAQNLLDATLQFLGVRFELHRPCDLNDLVDRDGLVVLDVLLLFPVSRRLLQRLDDQGRRSRDDRDGGLTVLDSELDGDAETLLYSVQKE